jgi:hypothetical protein
LYAQAYYIKNGKVDGKAVFNMVNESAEFVGQVITKVYPNIITTGISYFGYSKAINIGTMVAIADDSFSEAFLKATQDTDTYLVENNKVIDSVGAKILNARKDNKKVIFVSHSQGNSVVEAGVKKITTEFFDLNEELEKYMGVMHVASPVPPINYLPEFTNYKQRNIRFNRDLIINGLSILPKYPLSPAPVTHNIISRDISSLESDFFGHFFSETYLSDSITVAPVGFPNAVITARNLFKERMINLAEELEDNCDKPNIVIETADGVFDKDDPSKLIVSGYAGQNRMINLKAYNSNEKAEDKDTTKFEWRYRKFIPANYFSIEEKFPFFEEFESLPTSTDLNTLESINFPFNNINFMVSVTATDKNGKTSTRGITFFTPRNYVPTLTLESNQCTVQNDGFTYSGSVFVYRINDDSIASRGQFQRNVENEFFDLFFPVVNFTDSLGAQAVTLEVPNPCANRFNVGSPKFFCDGSRSAIAIESTSVKGVEVYFGNGGTTTYARNYKPGGTWESVYLYPGSVAENVEENFSVKVLDRWSGELRDAGEVTISHCPSN